MADKVYNLKVIPGVQRDGTDFACQNYINGQWMRFYGIYPQKIGGYSQIYGIPPTEVPCFAATTADLDSEYNNGAAGVGATLRSPIAVGAFTVDGTTPAVGDRILVKDQTLGARNGIYTVTVVGNEAFRWVLTRATDYDTPEKIQPGNLVPIYNGNAQSNTSWLQTATVTVIGTTPIVFSLVPSVGTVGYRPSAVPRGTYVVPNPPNFNVYIGDRYSLRFLTINANAEPVGAPPITMTDRTPALFRENVYNQWTFDTMFSGTSNGSALIAHAAPNLFSIDSRVETPIYYGNLLGTSPLVPTGFSVSGGFVVLAPYLLMFGNDGGVIISQENDPTVLFRTARVTAQKIVFGMPTRGGNSSPAGVLWSLNAVLRVTLVGDAFRFDTVTSESSILSSNSVIEMEGRFYWAGLDRFLVYNGIVQELPNSMNLQYFFDNVNYAQRQKVWATKITHYGEIWWHYPVGDNEECTHVLIFNTRLNVWYDTQFEPEEGGPSLFGRSSGYFNQTLAVPVWTDSYPDPEAGNVYSLWAQETGVDKNIQGELHAIPSYFETGSIAWCAFDANMQRQGLDRWVSMTRLEPDFMQTGAMTLFVNGREYARSEIKSSEYQFDSATVKIDIREQRREMTLKFLSTDVGGYYQMGQILMTLGVGDGRQ